MPPIKTRTRAVPSTDHQPSRRTFLGAVVGSGFLGAIGVSSIAGRARASAIEATAADTGAVYLYDLHDPSRPPTKLAPPGLDSGDFFGVDVSAAENRLAIGAGLEDGRGAVYVYDLREPLAAPTRLSPAGLDPGDGFGISVTATGRWLAVGAAWDERGGADTGAVYVYDLRDLARSPTKVAPTNLDSDDWFGISVAAAGNRLAVGARNDDDGGTDAGAVYLYDLHRLKAPPTKLVPAGLGPGDWFTSVAAGRNRLATGVLRGELGGTDTGAAYVYDLHRPSLPPTALAPDYLETGDMFGTSMAIAGRQLVVGAHGDDDGTGAAYVYDLHDLSSTPTKLAPADLSPGDVFGVSTAMAGRWLAVGAQFDDEKGTNAGAVYLYEAQDLSATPTKLTPPGIDPNDFFGFSLGLTGDHLAVGALRDEA